jgi:hypothetical protein
VQTFARSSDGKLVVSLYEGHIALLGVLLTEIRALIEAGDRHGASGDPSSNRATARLFPSAYLDPTEDVAEREWQALVHDDLVRGRLAAFDDVRSLLTLGHPGPSGAIVIELDAEQEEHLLSSLNDIRLVLAEIVAGAKEDPEEDEVSEPPGDVIRTADVLEWLTDLVSELVDLKLAGFSTE